MKKTLSLLLIIITLFVALTSCKSGPVSNFDGTDSLERAEYTINGEPVSPSEPRSATFKYNGIADLVFELALRADQYAHLVRNCSDLEITASAASSDGLPFTLIVSSPISTDTEVRFTADLGGVFAEDYMKEFSVTWNVTFTDSDRKEHTVELVTDPVSVYDVVHAEYCDRSDVETAEYKYLHENTYSYLKDLSAHILVLSSVIKLEERLGNIVNPYENEFYSSIYKIEYFDGLMTVSMKNGEMLNPSLLRIIIFDGEPIYFEVHEGIIRVVLEE